MKYWEWYFNLHGNLPEDTIAYSDWLSDQTQRMNEFHLQQLKQKDNNETSSHS